MSRLSRSAFLALIVAQAAHSIEEYFFRLFDVFAPARFVSGLLSSDLALGFALANLLLVSFGVWCYLARVRRDHPLGRGFAWFWAVLEFANGVGHSRLALSQGYFPGAATAPLLLGVSTYLAVTLARSSTQPAVR